MGLYIVPCAVCAMLTATPFQMVTSGKIKSIAMILFYITVLPTTSFAHPPTSSAGVGRFKLNVLQKYISYVRSHRHRLPAVTLGSV